ncbi:uncharacterized protein LOC127738486 isoform X3 [Mytilus californianus]|uniref:uncharacterized protein LOC127738486 isoform X3 n=1 Tax=Mytilus californianus TaxID=6549 RepID=UPI0022452B7D|nr:uncharacterized protein LOC127738486 isoform X3 [Mytilus californianus]
MEFPYGKIFFEKGSIYGFENSSYNDEVPLPPGICGRRQQLGAYLQPCNRYGKGMSSNQDYPDYLSVQGSVRSSSHIDKVSDKFHDSQGSKYIIYKGERRHNNRNREELNDIDDIRIYSEIGDPTILSTTEQTGIEGFDQRVYVEGQLNSYKKDTNKESKHSPCSPCKIIVLITITAILLSSFGLGFYFFVLRNISTDENLTSSVTETTIKTMDTSTSVPDEKTTSSPTETSTAITIMDRTSTVPVSQPSTFVTITSGKASTEIFTNPDSSLTTPTDEEITSTKDISSSLAQSSTTQSYCSPTGNTILQLSPDQIANLGMYRSWFLHSCEADIGYPPGNLSIEIMKSGELEFRKLDVTIERSEDNKTSCEFHRKIEFGILFTSDMEKAIIRCKVMNKFFPDSSAFYSNNETILLIPGDACKDNTVSQSYRVHPTNCHYYIECQNKVPYGRACQYNYCFGIYTVETCSPCNDVTCPATNDSCANVIILQKKTVNITVHADQIVGLTSPRTSNLHTCTGNVGNPPENIEVEIRLTGDDNYQTIFPSYTTKTDTTVNCGITRVLKFWIGFTTAMYNATIRCKVTNDLNPDDSPAYSNPETLYLVSGDFCYQNYNGTIGNRYHHRSTCHRFVTCVGKVPYVNACPSSLCFSLEKDYCDNCPIVETCP